PLTLVTQGRSTYSIVISERASPIEQKAAHEFQRLLELSTQVNLPIVASPPKGSFEILIGQAAKNYTKDKQESNLGADGFVIKSQGNLLLINGGNGKGVLYGV